MLELERLSVNYGPVRAVNEISLTVGAGEIVALVGANGAGKSSTMKAIVGLAEATGSIRFDGKDISETSSTHRVGDGIALSPEGRHVFAQMSVLENLQLGTVARTQSRQAALVEEMFELFPRLCERSTQRAGSMSGGEQQMLAIARALMSEPKIFILDEPTLGLAPIIVDQIAELLIKLRQRKLGLLLAEQNAEMALEVADRAYVMETGAIVKEGPSATIAADPAIQKAYLGF
ncbi:ABC transporter ATP-binding protein [Tardiphaga sp. 862_B3_N4_1]|jgi:branched-chain amino acid transport system ATP-binding protein|uniref:ABC transporter ATP-binding protein n=1 Tax=Tardiphaga sp. 862_B3_N4_1 TaxID=3240764 RepID=UPI003F25D42C